MRCVGFSGMPWSFVTTLCSPNEDFGNPKNILDQPCATPPPFWQTCLFTNSSNISTTICGSQFLGIREKAGLSKWGGVAHGCFGPPVWALFQGCEYSFWATLTRKCAQKDGPKCFSGFQNLRLGSLNFARWLQKIVATYDTMCWFFWDAMIFCNNFTPPKRRFWKAERTFRVLFRSTFQGVEYCIWATKRWKVLRKRTLKCRFGIPKSSFGEHKICKMITKDSSNIRCDVLVFMGCYDLL